jgi:serine/threonine protein kinase
MSEVEFTEGTQIDRYIIDKFLGRGGMAVVYSVYHAQLGTPHALKILTTPSESVRKRLLQEGRVQAQLLHPNIVQVSDVIIYDGSPGLVMEYVEGPALSMLLSEARLSVVQTDSLARGIIAGVAAAHKSGVIHRDLKPANILLKITPSGLIPKVADFGLVKVVKGDEHAGHTMTQTGMALGTPSYMAPEQIRDTRNVDLRADVFSLGAILYEMVCGQIAFKGDDLMELLTAVVSGDFIPPNELAPNLPKRMEKAILGCLEIDKENRIPDCDTLLKIWSGGEEEKAAVPIDFSGAWSDGMLEKVTALGAGDMKTSEFSLNSGSFGSSNEIKTAAMDQAALERELGDSFEAVTGRVRDIKALPETEHVFVPASSAPKFILGSLFLLALGGGALWLILGSDPVSVEQEILADPEQSELNVVLPPEEMETIEPPVTPTSKLSIEVQPDPVQVRPKAKAVPAPVIDVPAVEEPVLEEPVLEEPVLEEPEAAPVTTASFSFQGDAQNVWLQSTSGDLFSPGKVPPGHYRVRASFGEDSQVVKEVDMVVGKHIIFKCQRALRICQ